MNLCICNNCGDILEDFNPSEDSLEFGAFEHQVEPLTFDENESAWVCPNCNTDGYLMDITEDNKYQVF